MTTIASLARHLDGLLAEAGFDPQVISGDIVFVFGGRQHVVQFSDEDPCFVAIHVQGIRMLETGFDLHHAHVASNDANQFIKLAKVCIREQKAVDVSVEFLVPDEQAIGHRLMNIHLRIVKAAIEHFDEAMVQLASAESSRAGEVVH